MVEIVHLKTNGQNMSSEVEVLDSTSNVIGNKRTPRIVFVSYVHKEKKMRLFYEKRSKLKGVKPKVPSTSSIFVYAKVLSDNLNGIRN